MLDSVDIFFVFCVHSVRIDSNLSHNCKHKFQLKIRLMLYIPALYMSEAQTMRFLCNTNMIKSRVESNFCDCYKEKRHKLAFNN